MEKGAKPNVQAYEHNNPEVKMYKVVITWSYRPNFKSILGKIGFLSLGYEVESAYKPGSVEGNYSSMAYVTVDL